MPCEMTTTRNRDRDRDRDRSGADVVPLPIMKSSRSKLASSDLWPHPVTVYSAYGLVQKVQKQDPSLETLGMPRAVDDPPVEDPPVEEAAPA